MSDDDPRMRDIVVLVLFALLLWLVETVDRDVPGWWLEGEGKGKEG